MWYRRFFPWQPNWANGFKFKLKKIYYSLSVLRSLLSPNDSLQTNKKNSIATVTIKQNGNNIGAEKNKKETDREGAREMEKKWRATAHRPNRKSSETKQTCTYSAQQENGSHARARAPAHTKKCCSFTLLYSTPYRLLCIFFSLTFSL